MKITNKTETNDDIIQIKQSNKQHYSKSMFIQNNTVCGRTKEKAIPF